MDFLNDAITEIEQTISKNEFLNKNTKITASFPGKTLPTELKKHIVCIGIKNLRVENTAIGESKKTVSETFNIKIYTPFSRGSAEKRRVCAEITKELNKNGFFTQCEWFDSFADINSCCYICESSFEKEGEIDFEEEFYGTK